MLREYKYQRLQINNKGIQHNLLHRSVSVTIALGLTEEKSKGKEECLNQHTKREFNLYSEKVRLKRSSEILAR